ncbi:MAG: 8-oxo-dGTP diphosphatase MutT [Methylacidiphilales bacterium]|nr:8-oxo-dGTP diphosphatase MutT [Candidatus Methylacidiphilales bacterium]NJR18539.1 8-oxo-dGTP diphosphatase MutT [Calothrix sp. CSU_2_0]
MNLPHKIIGVAVIWDDTGKILIDRRLPQGAMGGLWEFPGGKVEPSETVEDCIKREVKEELGIDIEVGDCLITIDHTYTHLRVTLTVHHCRYVAGIPQPIECAEVRWVGLDELETFEFPEANTQIIAALKQAKSFL